MNELGQSKEITKVIQSQTIHQILNDLAEKQPDSIAIMAPGRTSLTYRRLHSHIYSIAKVLRKLGISRNDRVAIVLPNGPEIAVAFLATAISATCAPLNPGYRAGEFEFYLSDIRAEALIIQAEMESPAREVAESKNIPIIELTPQLNAEAGIFKLKGSNIRTQSRDAFSEADDIALILHTSGTTSRPKLVPLTQANVCASAHNITKALEMGASDRCLNVMPLFHTYGLIGSILSTLIVGASVVCTNGFSALDFFVWLEEYRPTWFSGVPTIHRAILEYMEPYREAIKQLPLRLIRSGTSPLPTRIAEELERAFGAPVIDYYGMTEAASLITCNPLPPRERKVGSVGILIGTEVAIMDEAGRLQQNGELGEIVIRGTNLFRGYENNSAANREAFIDGWFRTGDLGYFDKDGYLFLAGRLKEIINRAGEKIGPLEVDAVLKEHSAVVEAVTFGVPHATLGEDIVAAVVKQEGVSVTARELREFAFKRLADFRVPSQILFVRNIPKGPTGKPKRLSLAKRVGHLLKVDFALPRNSIEKALVGMWRDILDNEKIGIYDNFFALGGDSLRATQLVSRLRSDLQAEVSLETIFREPTVADLAVCVQKANKTQQFPISPVKHNKATPLSFSQQRLWFLDQLVPGNPAYNISVYLQMNGRLNVKVLEQVITEIIRRHGALRTSFTTLEGDPVQTVSPDSVVTIPIVDLSGLSEVAQQIEVSTSAVKESQHPFDLAQGPLIRCKLLRLGLQEHVLLLTMHHIVSDGWSRGVLLRELIALYKAFVNEKPSPLPKLPIQYTDFTLWQREQITGEQFKPQLSYWKQQLANAPALLELPVARVRPPAQSYRGARIEVWLSGQLTEQLKILSRQNGCTFFMVLFAAFNILLSRYTGQTDIIIGSATANRNRAEIEPLIGFFVNNLVLRTDLSGNPRFLELLDRVRNTMMSAYAHQDIPFEKLVEELQVDRSLAYNPLFQVAFNLQNAPMPPLELPGLSIEPLEFDSETARFDLEVNLWETQSGLKCQLIYNTDLFERIAIERFAEHFKMLLMGVVANPEQQLTELPILTDAETDDIFTKWSDIETRLPQKGIHELFESQAERTPELVAVAHGSQRVTYSELNKRADALARYLESLEVGPNVLVGICIEPSVDLVVGLLAILKAGGAYVPLDINYPRERLLFLLNNAQIKVLLTQTRFRGELPAHIREVCIDAEQTIYKSPDDECKDLREKSALDDLLYAIFTSGSTGQPKLAGVSHRGFFNLLNWFISEFDLGHGDSTLIISSVSFDLTQKNIFAPLVVGGTLYFSQESYYNPQQILQTVEEIKATWLNCTPSAFYPLVGDNEGAFKSLASLRYLFLGGEPISMERLESWVKSSHFQAEIVNTYGPTECTDVCAFYRLADPINFIGKTIPIGRPIPNTQLLVLGKHEELLPIGVIGELYIGGAGVGNGYLNSPELTREKFVQDPFRKSGSKKLYKTGDLVRCGSTGNLEFLGRIDHQVKIRGFRIELGEIEGTLRQYSGVEEVVIQAREDSFGQSSLIAYLLPKEDVKLTTGELQDFLKKKLPHYMVPSAFIVMESFPLTPNGKIDRNALPLPNQTQTALKDEYAPPGTSIEKMLATCWQDVLELKQVSIYDDFFAVGGHSLLATRVISRIRREFQIELPLPTFFEAPTIASLANAIAQLKQRQKDTIPSRRVIDPVHRGIPETLLAELHQFSESEMDVLINQYSSRKETGKQ